VLRLFLPRAFDFGVVRKRPPRRNSVGTVRRRRRSAPQEKSSAPPRLRTRVAVRRNCGWFCRIRESETLCARAFRNRLAPELFSIARV
jgi:hypothetical protein